MGLVKRGRCGLVLVVLALSLFEQCHGQGKGYPVAPTCERLQCPVYKVIDSQKDFEIRSYEKATWISSPKINSTSFQEATRIGFSYLFAYINGQNKQGATIDMTAPVIKNIYPSSDNTSYISYFYLPEKFQNNPPESDTVKPVKLPELPYVAVRRFSGFMDDQNVAEQLSLLKKSLVGTSWDAAIAAKSFSTAGYNSPRESENRVNEVMIWF